MVYLNLVLCIAASSGLIYVAYLIKKNWAQEALNIAVAEEMQVIVENAMVILNTHQTRVAARNTDDPKGELFDDPSLVASILTAIVKKYGNIKVSLKDFEAVNKKDHISVYADNNSKELILSLDHDLAAGDQVPTGFYNPDDGTFH